MKQSKLDKKAKFKISTWATRIHLVKQVTMTQLAEVKITIWKMGRTKSSRIQWWNKTTAGATSWTWTVKTLCTTRRSRQIKTIHRVDKTITTRKVSIKRELKIKPSIKTVIKTTITTLIWKKLIRALPDNRFTEITLSWHLFILKVLSKLMSWPDQTHREE